jgi:hypothetical protein
MDRALRGWADTSGRLLSEEPATHLQEGWLSALDDGVSASSFAYVWDLQGRLDEEVLREALQRLVERHDALRTTYRRELDGARQLVWPAARVGLALVDLHSAGQLDGGAVGRARVEREVERLIAAEIDVPLDLIGTRSLWRGFVVRVEPTHHVLVVVGHHSLMDIASQGILHEDLAALYREVAERRPTRLTALPAQLGDVARWQREPLPRVLEEFWRGELSKLPPALDLPYAPGRRDGRYRQESFALPRIGAAEAQALRAIAASVGASVGTALRALVAGLLLPYAGDALVIGVVHANRRQVEFAGVIGEVADQLPVRIDVSGDPSFPELVRRAHEAWIAARKHEAQLGAIARAVSGERAGSGGQALYEVAVNWFPGGLDLPAVELPGVDGAMVTLSTRPPIDARHGEFDRPFHGVPRVGVNMSPSDDGCILTDIWTSAAAFSKETQVGLARAFGELVGAVAGGSQESLRAVVPRVVAR